MHIDLSLCQPKIIFLEVRVVAKFRVMVKFASLERGDRWLDSGGRSLSEL